MVGFRKLSVGKKWCMCSLYKTCCLMISTGIEAWVWLLGRNLHSETKAAEHMLLSLRLGWISQFQME